MNITFFLIVQIALSASQTNAQNAEKAASLTLYTGDCYVWQKNKTTSADIGQSLYRGDSIKTGKDSKAEISFSDGTIIRLGEKSNFYIDRADSIRSFKLLVGKFWAKVAKLTGKQKFQVESPTAVAGVRGTIFKVEVSDDSTSRIAVEEGQVEVHQPRKIGRIIRLAALQEAFAKRGIDPSEPAAYNPNKEIRWERWTKKIFLGLVKTAKSALQNLKYLVNQEDRLLKRSQTMLSKVKRQKQPDAMILKQSEEIRQKTFDNRRKWRLINTRAEKRFRQLTGVLGRITDDPEIGNLRGRSEEVRTDIDNLTLKFDDLENQIFGTLDQMEKHFESYLPKDDSDIETRLKGLKDAEIRLNHLQIKFLAINASCDVIQNRLTDYQQGLIKIREIYPTNPILAKDRFWALRQNYFLFKNENNGFNFPLFEKSLPEIKSTLAESRRLIARWPKGDDRLASAREMLSGMLKFGNRTQALWMRIKIIERQSILTERMISEIESLIKL